MRTTRGICLTPNGRAIIPAPWGSPTYSRHQPPSYAHNSVLTLLSLETFQVSKSRKPGSLNVLLVHGFGASIGHFKKSIVALVDEGHSVHAIDLLGFGESEKPLDYSYSMEGWRDLLVSYVKDEIVGRSGEGEAKVVIAGNSIGSLASLMAARALVEDSLRDSLAGVVLFNCAGGMNNAATLDDDWRIRLAYPIFALINALLKIEPVAKFLFGKFSTKENIEGVLRQVYMNQDAVDEDLVDLIHEPSTKPGALEAFVSILTGPPGPRPEKHVPTLVAAEVPIFVLWGTTDPFTPIDGPVAKFFLDELEPAHNFVTKAVVDDVGHCPHDDRPEVVHQALMPWLSRL